LGEIYNLNKRKNKIKNHKNIDWKIKQE
jgi:hypothetical protein